MMANQEQTQLWLKEGATIKNEGREYVVLALADLNLVLAKELGSGEKVLLRITDFITRKTIDCEAKAPASTNDLWAITSEDWKIAEQRRAYIAPLLGSPYHKRAGALAEKIAGQANVAGPQFIDGWLPFGQLGFCRRYYHTQTFVAAEARAESNRRLRQ